MEFKEMKDSLGVLIKNVKSEIDIIYNNILDDIELSESDTIFKGKHLRYLELKSYLDIYNHLFNIEDEKEFDEVLNQYIDLSLNVIEDELDKNIQTENYENCIQLKNEKELISKLLK